MTTEPHKPNLEDHVERSKKSIGDLYLEQEIRIMDAGEKDMKRLATIVGTAVISFFGYLAFDGLAREQEKAHRTHDITRELALDGASQLFDAQNEISIQTGRLHEAEKKVDVQLAFQHCRYQHNTMPDSEAQIRAHIQRQGGVSARIGNTVYLLRTSGSCSETYRIKVK